MNKSRLGIFAALLLAMSGTAARPAGTVDRMVDVGGYKLHAVVQGSAKGTTIVFCSGLGEDANTWSKVQPVIARRNLTVSYDRAGLGKSQSAPGVRDLDAMVTELHALLQRLHAPGPYVLVGHSLGGYILRAYSSRYPRDIAGLVFVDPVPEGLEAALRAQMTPHQYAERLASIRSNQGAMPDAVKRENDSLEQDGIEVASATHVPAVPVVLLSGTKKNPAFPGNPLEQDLKLNLQRVFLGTLSHPAQVLVPESRHYVQDDAPWAVINAIVAVLATSGNPV